MQRPFPRIVILTEVDGSRSEAAAQSKDPWRLNANEDR